MSLRVLLADESDTIKKVFQLALQDMNAEVKSVHSGLDVMDVAKAFQPTIIFADILLQKKNGYEICLQIKQSADLAHVPVVLMWSSFMELDQEQYKRSQANDQLEKPFDADLLREIVKRHSGMVDDNPMAAFLNFPDNMSESAPSAATPSEGLSLNFDLSVPDNKAPSSGQTAAIPLGESEVEENTSEFNLGAILGEESSETAAPTHSLEPDSMTRPALSLELGDTKNLFDDLALEAAPTTNQESWKEKDLSHFKIAEDKSDDLDQFEALNLSSTRETTQERQMRATPKPIVIDEVPERLFDSIPSGTILEPDPIEPFSLSSTSSRTTPPVKENTGLREPTNTATKSVIKTSTMKGMNDSEIEAIVRAHTEEVLKNQLRDSLLDMVEKIVREELNRIMDEEIRLQQDADLDS